MVRPASETPSSALALAERAGIPAGAFSVVTGPAQPIVDAQLASPTTRALSFTGSTEVGRRLLAGGLSGSDATDEVVTGFGHGWTYSATPDLRRRRARQSRHRRARGPARQRARGRALTARRAARRRGDHPLVGEVRGVGMLAALEFVQDKSAKRFFEPQGRVGAAVAAACLERV